MNSFLFNKKSQANTYFAVIIFLLEFGIMSLIGYVLTTETISAWAGTDLYTAELAVAGNSFLMALLVFDKIIVLMMVVLIVGVGTTSYRLASSPVYFILNFLMAGLYGLVSYFFNYIFAQIASQAAFTTAIAYFPITVLICTNLHWIMLICIIVGSITLYGKREKGQFLT